MRWFEIVALLISVSALFSFINYKFFRLPKTVGLMLISLFTVSGLLGLRLLGVDLVEPAAFAVQSINFSEALLQGVLCFLLFAGALHINIGDLLEQKWPIGILSSVGVVISAFIIAGVTWLLFPILGFPLPFLLCLLFGALISPTDPVATLALLKESNVPKSVSMKIAGEALFNDGTGKLGNYDGSDQLKKFVELHHLKYMLFGRNLLSIQTKRAPISCNYITRHN